ncbi:MAG: copper transporter [Coriobacteriales bacterium]|nr:copper transporter [Coriobacteriales bacterium]
MYNLRYHIASLVAVFLALALGLVLGGVVVDRGTLDAQRAALVNSLRSDFRRLTAENTTLKRDLALQKQFADASSSAFVKDRLDGKRVVIVSNTGRSDSLEAARSVIEEAGGGVGLVTVQQPGLGLETEAVRKALSSDGTTDAPVPDAGSVVTSLAAEWATGAEARPVTDALIEGEAIHIEGLDKGAAADGMVLVASVDDKPDAVLVQLGSAFQKEDQPTIGAETLSQRNGVSGATAEAGLGAVNAVDTASGKWALVEMLAGGGLGFYGVGPDVDGPFPPVPPVPVEPSQSAAR